MSVSTALCKRFMPDMMKRLFYITTLFTFLVRRSHREVNYNRLYGVCLDWTPSDETFNLPGLFTETIWRNTPLGEMISEEVVTHNKISMDDIERSTPDWLRYGHNSDIMQEDTLLVYRVVLMELNDPSVRRVSDTEYQRYLAGH